jgi:hypothetical protein
VGDRVEVHPQGLQSGKQSTVLKRLCSGTCKV